MNTLFIWTLLGVLPVAPSPPKEGLAPAFAPTPTSVAPVASTKVCSNGTCVPDEDLSKMVAVLREKQCLQSTDPTFLLDPVTITVDKDGRVFYSGAQPRPYTVQMRWCNYEVEAKGKVEVVAAVVEPPIWGFRFRPKAYIGVLPLEPLYLAVENAAKDLVGEPTDDLTLMSVIDAGVMADFLYYDWLNLNAAVGFRSLGGGLGADITPNFGAYIGYANTWGSWHHNVNLAFWFSFYNPN